MTPSPASDEGAGPSVHVLASSRRGDGGQFVLLVRQGRQRFVLKHFGEKRGWLLTSLRQLGYRLGLGKSSIRARDRFATELALLRLWRAEGVDVPEVYQAGDADTRFIAMEYCPGPNLKDLLRKPSAPEEQKLELVRRYAESVGARHAAVRRCSDPRLVHTHPSPNHVLVSGERLVFFDLETTHDPRRDVDVLVSLELLSLLGSLARTAPELAPAAFAAFAAAYPDRAALGRLRRDFYRSRGPLFSWLARAHVHFSRRRGPGKGKVLDLLERTLAGAGPGQATGEREVPHPALHPPGS
jgi:tRNA A-37 threonylcarbamoyl transferase component Bud32